MKLPFGRWIWLIGCVGLAACDTGPGPPGTMAIDLTSSSWDVTLQMTLDKALPAPVVCATVPFTMRVEPQPGGGSGRTVLVGANGSVFGGGKLARMDSRTLDLVGSLQLPYTDCNIVHLEMSSLSLRVSDADGDFAADGLSGTGTGKGVAVVGGDVSQSFSFTFTMTGRPDVTPPALMKDPDVTHPLSGISLTATEPLRSTAQMSFEGTVSIPLTTSEPVEGAIGHLTSNVILPFYGRWTLMGDAQDLAGLPLVPDIRLATISDPGLFAVDGFEGHVTPSVGLTGEASVVSNVGTLPALNGNRSLLVVPLSSATFHLARPAGAASVRFTVRLLAQSSYVNAYGLVSAGVIGGVHRSDATIPNGTALIHTDDAQWTYATESMDVTIPLLDAGDDVVLFFSAFPQPGCGIVGLCAPVPAMLIDDVRVE